METLNLVVSNLEIPIMFPIKKIIVNYLVF